MACNYLNFRQLEKINTQRQQNEIFMTFLLRKATKRPVDKRRNQNVKPHKKLGLKNKKENQQRNKRNLCGMSLRRVSVTHLTPF